MNQQDKLKLVATRLGLTALPQMQGSTGNIFDTLPRIAAAGAVYNFFKNVNQRAFPDTNLSQNRFEVGEALLIENLCLFQRNDTNVFPQPVSPYSGNSLLNFYVANQRVIKDLPISNFVSPAGISNVGGNFQNGRFYLAPTVGIVIPPQVEFYAEVICEDAVTANFALGLELYGTKVLTNLNGPL